MKRTVAILMIALAGCGRREAVLAEPSRLMVQVHSWVPSGTAIAEATRTLEDHKFGWVLVTNSSFPDLTNATLLVCVRPGANAQAEPTVHRVWSVAFVITNGNVSNIRLIKGMNGL